MNNRVPPFVGKGKGGVVDASMCFKPKEYAHIRLHGDLPHWEQPNALQFVTFRLADSMPVTKVKEYQIELETWKKKNPKPWTDAQWQEYEDLNDFLEKWLDVGYGDCILSMASIQSLLNDSLVFLDGKKYDLYEYVIMPNHVHLIILPYTTVDDCMHSLKGYTGAKINKLLGRNGQVWQRESFDRLIRSVPDYISKAEYIRNNPKSYRE